MQPVAVVTDSTHYTAPGMLEAAGVREVSLYVNEGPDRQTRESDMPDFDAFYARLVVADELPTTSQPSIGDFLEVFEPLAAAGQDIVAVHISGEISGTVESARQAAAELVRNHPDRRVEVIDTRGGAGMLGLIALATASAANAGADVAAVAAHAREASTATKVWFAVDTLEFLRRGGRIGAAQAWLGGALKIKPILTIDGEVTPVERVRTAGRVFDRLVEKLQARLADGADAWIVQHIRAPDEAQRLVERGREIFGCEPVFVTEIGPVFGAHIGPGLLGVGGVPARLLGGPTGRVRRDRSYP